MAREGRNLVSDDPEVLRDLFSRKWTSCDELKRIEQDSGKKFRRGRFSKAETDTCMEAVDKYLRDRGINREEFIDLMFVRNHEKSVAGPDFGCKDFFINIAGQLDGRPVVNVYHFLRRRLHPNNLGETWNPELDEELKRLHLLHGPQWEKIGRELGRFHIACRDRFRKVQAAYIRGPWTETEVNRLNEAYSMAEHGEKPEGIATWTFISNQVGSRSANQCQWKWTENITFRTMHPDKRRVDWDIAEDRALVNSIYDLGIEHQSEISWSALTKEVEMLQKFTPGRLRHRWSQLKKRVRNVDALPIDDICDLLMRDLAPLSPELISDSEITDKDASDKEQ